MEENINYLYSLIIVDKRVYWINEDKTFLYYYELTVEINYNVEVPLHSKP